MASATARKGAWVLQAAEGERALEQGDGLGGAAADEREQALTGQGFGERGAVGAVGALARREGAGEVRGGWFELALEGEGAGEVAIHVGEGLVVGVEGGSLRMQGTAEAPIRVVGVNDRRGTWDAIRLHERSAGNVIEHVLLRNAGGAAAVEVKGGADLKVDGLECARCYSPALTWTCDAKVNAQGLAIKDGTPAEMIAPSGCGP